MAIQLNNPRQIARDLLKDSVSSDLWRDNQQFVVRFRDRLQQHPITHHPAIQALNQASFGLDAMRKIHLDYRHAIVQIFTDALLMAQVQSRQVEQRLASGTKMYARFLLTLNTLDEVGFKPGTDQSGYYRGNPLEAHYPLYERVLDSLGVSINQRAAYTPSPQADSVRTFLEDAYGDFNSVVALLAVGERVVVLFSAPLRENAKAVGVETGEGYYLNHGASDDMQAKADDDTHEDDLWYVLMQSLLPTEYERVTALCDRYCDLWMAFWDAQMLLTQEQRVEGEAVIA
ncbi:MAG: hypothetical protein KME06_20925 [Kastovskya adunca ATA6-11-RM4]|jgi:hypothetical protein|nr:hypothetical protein [Kastovskya adunca ATA6-11-RM4]